MVRRKAPTASGTSTQGGQHVKTYYKPTSSAYAPPPMTREQANAKRDAAIQRARDLKREQTSPTGRVKGFAKHILHTAQERGRDLNREISISANRPRTPAASQMGQMPSDPFGVGSFGSPFAPMRNPPINTAPRRRAKRRRSERDEGSGYPDMFGIPEHMRHMF